MTYSFTLPDLGEGVHEGEIVEWLVETGASVSEDQPLVEIETDKAIVEIPSPKAGTIIERHGDIGEVVTVGSPLVTIELVEEASEASLEETGETAPDRPAIAPPSVRQRAREASIDLSTVEGTGPGGRISMEDLEAAIDGEAESPPATATESPAESTTPAQAAEKSPLAVPAARERAKAAGIDLAHIEPTGRHGDEPIITLSDVEAAIEGQDSTRPESVQPTPEQPSPTGDQRVPYRGLRRRIGERLETSATTIPQVTHMDLIDVEGLVELRASLKERAQAREVKLSYLPFICLAIAEALEAYPSLNAKLDEESEEIIFHDTVDLGIAVDTDDGLLVPVLEAVQDRRLLEIAKELETLTTKARNRELSREQLQGSTFTVTNVGVIGGEYATPMINPPEAGILATGAIKQRPMVVDGEVTARYSLPLSLTFDHRILDGADAARFTNEVASYLQTPALLLLE